MLDFFLCIILLYQGSLQIWFQTRGDICDICDWKSTPCYKRLRGVNQIALVTQYFHHLNFFFLLRERHNVIFWRQCPFKNKESPLRYVNLIDFPPATVTPRYERCWKSQLSIALSHIIRYPQKETKLSHVEEDSIKGTDQWEQRWIKFGINLIERWNFKRICVFPILWEA